MRNPTSIRQFCLAKLDFAIGAAISPSAKQVERASCLSIFPVDKLSNEPTGTDITALASGSLFNGPTNSPVRVMYCAVILRPRYV